MTKKTRKELEKHIEHLEKELKAEQIVSYERGKEIDELHYELFEIKTTSPLMLCGAVKKTYLDVVKAVKFVWKKSRCFVFGILGMLLLMNFMIFLPIGAVLSTSRGKPCASPPTRWVYIFPGIPMGCKIGKYMSQPLEIK